MGLFWAQDIGFNVKGLGNRAQPFVLVQPFFVVCNENPSVVDPSWIDSRLFFQRIDQVDHVRQELNLHIVGPQSPNQACRVPGRTSRQLVFLQQNCVGNPSFGQMVQCLTAQTSSAYNILPLLPTTYNSFKTSGGTTNFCCYNLLTVFSQLRLAVKTLMTSFY